MWTAVAKKNVPPSVAAKLDAEKLVDNPPVIQPPEDWTRRLDARDLPYWKTPAAGPFETRLDSGMLVTYVWYKFRDQPALLYSDFTEAELTQLQAVAEKMHTSWTVDGSYLAEPTIGTTLADVDPGQLVTPPAGLEVGYVPIVTKQVWGGFVDINWKQAASGNFNTAANWSSGAAPADRRLFLL